LNREYEYIPIFELKNFTGLVVDAGAHVGVFSLISSLFAKSVIALEPHPRNYSLLKTNIRMNLATNVMAINRALWHENGRLKIYEDTNSGLHSIYNSSHDIFFETTTITLQDILEEFGNIDLLKIDIEGAEFRIFENTNDALLKYVNAVVAEVHLNHGDICSIVRKLEGSGFNVHMFYPPLWKKKSSYSIRLYDLLKLKLTRNFLYLIMSLADFRVKDLSIVFGHKNMRS
jgi:FkbM family methyltransferase